MPNYGIGAGGQLGLAFEVLPPPVQSTPATATTGGTITAGTYRLAITAVNASGETIASNELTIVTTGATSTITANWAAVTGATSYKYYRSAAGGAIGTELFVATITAPTVTYVDTGTPTPAGALPTFNSASNPGVYVAPTKFFPINSELLKYIQDTQFRRPIRKTPDVLGAVAGNAHTEGPISGELLEDVLIYFLYASRYNIVKSGTTPNFIYTCTPSAVAIPVRTLSITVERTAGVVFGYVGCIVKGFRIGIANGMVSYNVDILGTDEASQPLPVPTWPTSVPFGVGTHNVEIPTGTPVFDTDAYEFGVDFNAVPEFRLKNTGRGAQFARFGESNTTISLGRDFVDRADYDAFKALTSQSLTMAASRGTNNQFSIVAPVSLKNTYEVGLGGQGDLIRAAITYQTMIDGSGNSHTLTVKTQENIT